ncbi:hypothetical protein LINGRAHAP2_LOCUS13431 [Linum grandiflorum]
MAYRRRHGMSKSSTFKEDMHHSLPESESSSSSKPKLTASHTFTTVDAIRASASHRPSSPLRFNKVFDAYEDHSPRSPSNTIWSALARKAKTILEEDDADVDVHHKTDDDHDQHPHEHNDDNVNVVISPRSPVTPTTSRFEMSTTTDISMAPPPSVHQHSYSSPEGIGRKLENNPKVTSPVYCRKTSDGNKTEVSPRKLVLQTPAASSSPSSRNSNNKFGVAVDPLQLVRPNLVLQSPQQRMHPQSQNNHTNPETQLKASRDVAMATAAKAKLLLRELKTVKADLAFAKQRCSQLEQENALLRESRDKGTGNPADDELIRLQLETLLAEKARLANENAFYARENCYLREIVEYHQLTLMHHDMVYLDDDDEDDEEAAPDQQVVVVYPAANMNMSPPPLSPISPPASPLPSPHHTNGIDTTATTVAGATGTGTGIGTSTTLNIALNNDDQHVPASAAVSTAASSTSAAAVSTSS